MKTTKIKTFFRILILIPVTMGMVNCSDKWLEPKPLSIFTPENAFVDARGMYGALTACERNMRYEWYGDGSPIITELLFSEVCVEGTTDKPGPAMNMNIQITPSSQLNSADYNKIGWFWLEGYKGIKYANVVISRIDQTKFTNEAERNAVLGSAYFHRAYRYYRLTQQFGDIPFIGKEITEPKLDFYSTKREVILQKMKKDMEFAAQWCTDNVDRGRVTKGACQHLLTKIDLALGDFDAAITAANGAIDGGVYSLMRTPFGAIPKEEGDYLTKMGVVRDDVISRLHWQANKAIGANKEVLFMVLSREDLIDSRLDLQIMRQAVPFWGVSNSNFLRTPDGVGPGTSDIAGQDIKLVETFGRGIGRARGTNYSTRMIWDDPNDLRHKKYNWMNMEDLVYNHPNLKSNPYYNKPLQLRDASGKVLTTDTIRNWYGWPHYKIYTPDPRRIQPQGGSYDWYNKGVKANNGQEYTMSPYHVLWPVPQSSVSSNTQGVINQNFGYDGYANNKPPLTVIPPDDDI